jgi:hypothetical protein
MPIVTKDWIKKHGTKGRGFTRAQIEALGIEYPPTSGWQDRVNGKEITEEQALRFTGNKKQSHTALEQIKTRITKLSDEDKAELKEWVNTSDLKPAQKQTKQKKHRAKNKFNHSETYLIKLHDLVQSGSDVSAEASSLIKHYMNHKRWTEKQIRMIHAITKGR